VVCWFACTYTQPASRMAYADSAPTVASTCKTPCTELWVHEYPVIGMRRNSCHREDLVQQPFMAQLEVLARLLMCSMRRWRMRSAL
jgi:hypothetical protein